MTTRARPIHDALAPHAGAAFELLRKTGMPVSHIADAIEATLDTADDAGIEERGPDGLARAAFEWWVACEAGEKWDAVEAAKAELARCEADSKAHDERAVILREAVARIAPKPTP